MSFDATEPLFKAPGIHDYVRQGRVLYDSTDAAVSGTDLAAVAGVAGGEFPMIESSASGTDLSGFQPEEFVVVAGFTAGANNGVFRVHESAPDALRLKGGLAGSIEAEAAGNSVTIRKLRIVRIAAIGAEPPGVMTLQATSATNLSGAQLQLSLDDGATWDDMPDVALPDTLASDAKVVNFFAGRDCLLRLDGVPSNYSGTIRIG